MSRPKMRVIFSCLCLAIIGFTYCESTISCAPEDLPRLAAKIRLRLYTGDVTQLYRDITYEHARNILDSIDDKKGFILYIHGFQETPESESVQTVIKAHLKRGDINIATLDWSNLAFDDYLTVACRVKKIGKILSSVFNELFQFGLDAETFHIVGHSLGAQIAGFIGKYSNTRIPRITGLDPASPGFYQFRAEHISANDAKFVDIIHTDGGVYGAEMPTGTVDFFANRGTRPQPGCPFAIPFSMKDLCSHHRSWRIYAESVLNGKAFSAVQCSSYKNFWRGQCNGNRRIYVGYETPLNATGTYYFTTNARAPFGNTV